jgi:hypothetical protein
VSSSPPPNQVLELLESGISEDDICRWVLEKFNDLVDALGIRASAVMLHPLRVRPEMKRIVNDGASQTRTNRYRWALNQEDFRKYLYFSPHVHALTFGLLEASDAFEARTGWIYRNHGPREGEELLKTAYYLLTHAWVRGNNKAVRYWRGMSTRNLGCDVKVRKDPVVCPVCGVVVARVDIGQSFQDLHNAPGAWRKVEMRSYYVRKRLKRRETL